MEKIKKIIAAALVLIVIATAALGVPATVQAATKTVTASIFYKEATVIKEGTTVVKMKNSLLYYVKFKAPKAGIYKLTFTGMKSVSGNEIGYGSMYVRKKEVTGVTPSIQQVKTNGGKKTHSLYMCTKYSWQNFEKLKYKGSKYDSAYTRTARIKLEKGEYIYLNGTFSGSRTPFNYKVTIKKMK